MRIGLIAWILINANIVFSQGISHERFNLLLRKHVTTDGKVNYKGFIKDSLQLNEYLLSLSKNPPTDSWPKNEIMAFWINAYNAWTIKLIINYYPLESIKDIGGKIQVPFVSSPWDIKFISIGKERLDLNTIEHIKLRKQFKDPRIHMALVCASKSCPPLWNQAFNHKQLDNQLTERTRLFLNDAERNSITPEKAQISAIFNWYEMDFKYKGESVRSFINTYANIKLLPSAKITYKDYDWSLNE